MVAFALSESAASLMSDQYRVWGSVAPSAPALPPGWSEAAAAPGAQHARATAEALQHGFAVSNELTAIAARGQYLSLALPIQAFDELNGVRISTGPLRTSDGHKINADNVDIRAARPVRIVVNAAAKTFRNEPWLLEKRSAFAVTAGQTALVWLTVYIPPDTAAGVYNGAVLIQSEGRRPVSVKLTIRVLPFALPPPAAEMGMFYRPADSDDRLRRELPDLREHGISAESIAFSVAVTSRDRIFGPDDAAATKAACRRLRAAIAQAYGKPPASVTLDVGHQIAYYWDHGRNWFAFWPHDRRIEDDLFKAIETALEILTLEDRPDVRIYAVDEAGAHNLLDEAVYYYRLIKQRLPRLTTYTTIGGGMALGADEIGSLAPLVDFLDTNRFTPEIARALTARRRPFGIYNGSGATPAGARLFFGFYGWKTGARSISQWTYYFGNAAVDGDGFRKPDEGYVYRAADGPLPSPMWEAVRGGIDDYRYLDLLWRQIAAAKRHSAESARTAGAAAEAAVRSLLAKIPWTVQPLDAKQRSSPPDMATLEQWRRQIAEQILLLQPLVGADGASLPAPPARSPFDFAWSEPPRETLAFEKDLFPSSDFEAGLQSWRIETWKGQGSGAPDAVERHGGRHSVRLDVPAGSGADAVTVLVWPTWGGGGLNLILEADRIYEFAAWIKSKDRRMPPSLRISLPDDAVKKSQTGCEQTTPGGWQRLWLRLELNRPAPVKYLAVWAQGSGVVWVDDVSLQVAVPTAKPAK
jgi:hypothetical protein